MSKAKIKGPPVLRTLAEMAGENHHGIACPRCGCRRSRVAKTLPGEDEVRRYRVCGNVQCLTRWRTEEK